MQYLFVIIGYTILLDIIVIAISIKLFNSESVLFRTAEEKSLKFWGKGKKDVLSSQFVMLVFFVLLLGLYYIGGSWQGKEIMSGLIKTQVLLIFLPVILILRISKTDIKSTLRLNKTNPINFLLVLIAAIPALTVVAVIGQAINLIFPLSESYIEGMKNLLTASDDGFWYSIFVIGILAGICEETLFRGYIINGFKKLGFWKSIIISGILFGIFHLDPFRLIPASLLGIWMGYLLLQTNSIFVPMFAHFINNSLTIIITTYGDKIPFIKTLATADVIPYWYIIPSGLIVYFVYLAINKMNHKSCLMD